MNVLLVGIVAGIVGLFAGYFGATSISSLMPEPAPVSMVDTMLSTKKAEDLRLLLNALTRQHVDLAAAAVRNGFDGDSDFEASAKALDLNSAEIAKAIGSIYGKEAETQFLESWRSHIGFFVDYTLAAKKGDKAGMDKALADLTSYAESVAAFLSTANPNLPAATVKQLFMEHIVALKGAVDAYGAGDYTKSYAEQAKAYVQVGRIADGLAGAIVKQYPDKFK